MSNPDLEVSVAIVTWNRPAALMKAIESVYEQSLLPAELVIVDNHSDCLEKEIIEIERGCKAHSITFKYIRTYKNLGCPVARNLAFSNCSTDFVYALDDDGWLDKNAIRNAVRVFLGNERQDDIVVVASLILSPDSEHILGNRSHGVEVVNLFSAGAALYRRHYLENGNYFPEYFRQMEESHFSLRCFADHKRIIATSDSIMYHEKDGRTTLSHIELKGNFINEICNLKELLSLHACLCIFPYKAYKHFSAYRKVGLGRKFFGDFCLAVFKLLVVKNSRRISLSDYLLFSQR